MIYGVYIYTPWPSLRQLFLHALPRSPELQAAGYTISRQVTYLPKNHDLLIGIITLFNANVYIYICVYIYELIHIGNICECLHQSVCHFNLRRRNPQFSRGSPKKKNTVTF